MSSRATSLKIIVAGAGLGGLSAAIALRRAGHEVTVLEQTPTFGTAGAGIQICPNASRLLATLGVVERFRDVGVRADGAVRRRWSDGKAIGQIKWGEEVTKKQGTDYWFLHRSDLHSALVSVATDKSLPGPHIDIQLDNAVTGVVSTGPDKAVVRTATGKEMTADLVIGADGIRSVVRRDLFGEKSPTFFGRVTNRMILMDLAPFLNQPEFGELFDRPLQNLWMGPGGSALTHPIRAGAGIYIGVTTSGLAADEAFWSKHVDKKYLIDYFAGWDPRLLQLVEASPDATGYGLHDSEPLPSWSIGRVCLLGDACHAMLPFQSQGAAQSIEDGAVLANQLTGAVTGDVEAAIARYVAIRRPRSIRVQEASRSNGTQWQLPPGPEQEKRDAEFAKTGGDFQSYAWLWTVGGDGGAPVLGPPAAEAA